MSLPGLHKQKHNLAIREITEVDTKYYHVVSSLDSATDTRAVFLLSAPPATGKYIAIKRFLTGAYALSECERASALVNLQGLGDSTPSELVDSMLSLLCGHTPYFLFFHLFMQQLPDYVRAPLSMYGIKDYRALSQEADWIYLSGRPRIQEVNIPKQSAKPNSKQPSDLYWYYQRFGKNARSGSPNCKHYVKKQGNASGSALDTATVGPRLQKFIITDTNTNHRSLVDTSAQVSVIPASYIDRRSGATTDPLQAANGSSLATYGARNASLCFVGRVYSVRLVIVDVTRFWELTFSDITIYLWT